MQRITDGDLLSDFERENEAHLDHLRMGRAVRIKNYAIALMFLAFGASALKLAW